MHKNIGDMWHTRQTEDGRHILVRIVRYDHFEGSFDRAITVGRLLAGTDAEKDFSLSINPVALTVTLHAFRAGPIPGAYHELARKIDVHL